MPNVASTWRGSDDELRTSGDQDILIPEIHESFDEKILPKKRGCRCREAQYVILRMTMRDRNGNGADLTNYGIQNSNLTVIDEWPGGEHPSSSSSIAPGEGRVQVRFSEASGSVSTVYAVNATILSATEGLVACRIPAAVTALPGIWHAEAGALDEDGNLLFTDEVFVYMERSAWGSTSSSNGPPPIDDIRLTLRDTPVENELLDEYDFSIAEIAHAGIRVIHFWNDQPPPVSTARYSTHNFPFKQIWLDGIHMFLFQLAEEHYRRNHFKHSTGGIQVDDKNRHREYNSAWKERFANFKRMVMHKKAQLNAANAYGAFGANYGAR